MINLEKQTRKRPGLIFKKLRFLKEIDVSIGFPFGLLFHGSKLQTTGQGW